MLVGPQGCRCHISIKQAHWNELYRSSGWRGTMNSTSRAVRRHIRRLAEVPLRLSTLRPQSLMAFTYLPAHDKAIQRIEK